MKIFVFSDIHGKLPALEETLARVEEEAPQLIVCCGDFLNHGPRNGIPEGYDPQAVAALLNSRFKDRLLCARGNCDSEVDQMMLDFPCLTETVAVAIPIADGGFARLFFHHGHKEFPTPPAGSVVVSGHTHIPLVEKRGNVFFANPGSISIPKGGSRPSYAVIFPDGQGVKIEVKPLDGSGSCIASLSTAE